MVEWFAIVLMIISAAAAIVCGAATLLGKEPNDLTMGLTVLVAVGLLAQIVTAIIASFVGNKATGDYLEFWLYLFVAFALPLGAGFWALIDRSKWSNLVLMIVHFSVLVMVYRMLVIWGVWV